MYHPKRRILSAIAAGTMGFGALVAQAAQPTTQPANAQDLQAQVDQLKAQVQALSATQQQNQADVTAAIQDVLKDADQHSKALAVSSGIAGYDPAKGIQITDDAGNFLVHPWIQIAPRYAFNERQNAPGHPSEEGFEIRRAKFGIDGYAFSPAVTYLLQYTTTRSGGPSSGGVPLLEDAWVKWMFSDDFGVQVGQFKDPLSHENLTSSKRLMAVERSYLNDVLLGSNGLGSGDDYVQGLGLIYANDGPVRADLSVTDGDQSQNTNFQNSAANNSDYGVAGRVEWMAVGTTWGDYDQFTSLNDKDDMLVIGLGADYTGEFLGTKDQLLHTIDAQYNMPNGLSLYGGYLGRLSHFHRPTQAPHQDYYDYGFIGQVGYLITDDLEPFARYDNLYLDSRPGAPFSVNPTGTTPFHGVIHELTLGANYYLHGHAAKITVDGCYLPNGASVGDSSGDILQNRRGTFVVRAQFQLLI